MFSQRIYEIFKNTEFEVCERLLLKPVLSRGLPFLITYTSRSNLYICFSFCISFVCRFCLQYYWYRYNQKQSSGCVLQKKCSWKFRYTHCWNWTVRSSVVSVPGSSRATDYMQRQPSKLATADSNCCRICYRK